MEKTLAHLREFTSDPKEVAAYLTTNLYLINLASQQGNTLPDSFFEGVIITTELMLLGSTSE
ncbi:MAG TPA: hypothetical protein VMW01_16570 [Williamwhitmania sp.]|nr:hypothetical protein [Williamwhitmania sp.]